MKLKKVDYLHQFQTQQELLYVTMLCITYYT